MAGRHEGWVVGFGDEVWWLRLAQPALHTWGEDALRLAETSSASSRSRP